MVGFWSSRESKAFEAAVEKATSPMIPAGHEDIAQNLEVCDQVRAKSVSAQEAMRVLKARLEHANPNVQILALGVRCAIHTVGRPMHQERGGPLFCRGRIHGIHGRICHPSAAPPCLLATGQGKDAAAVSYTHLRAHET